MITRFTRLGTVRTLVWVLIAVLVVQPCAVALAQTQDECAAKLKDAGTKFDNGDFDGSIALINECLSKGDLPQKEKSRAYELLAMNYTSKSYLEQADNAIKKLLELVPNYKPNPDQYSPSFVARVEKVKSEMGAGAKPAEQPADQGGGSSTKWLLIGGGVVAAGVLGYLIFHKSSSETTASPLPGPPGTP